MGIKIGELEINKLYTGSAETSKVAIGTEEIPVGPTVEPDYLCFEAVEAGSICFSIYGTLTTTPTLKYRVNTGTWNNYTFGNSINLTVGDKCFFKGNNNTFSQDSENYIYFTSTGNINASGNIMSLLDETCKSLAIPSSYCFRGLFMLPDEEGGCTTLLSAPKLPATTLTNRCYQAMFYGCSSLTSAPELPATTLTERCYGGMFSGCTSLTAAPELPATTLNIGCYFSIFYDCTSLTVAPELPATTLATECYTMMFCGCTSLKLSATQTGDYQVPYRIPSSGTGTDAEGALDYMFLETGGTFTGTPTINTTYYTIPDYLCFEAVEATNIAFARSGTLTNQPELYYKINNGAWTSYGEITTTGTNISLNAGDKCYWKNHNNYFSETYNKFIYFYSSGDIKASGNVMSLLDKTCKSKVIPCDDCFAELFQGCTNLLTAPELPATTLTESCYEEMFSGCTSLASAPELPATTLAGDCYGAMFYGCTSLTTAPELPATSLVNICYAGMFSECTSLTTPPSLPATTLAEHCYNSMFYGCTSLTTPPSLPATTLAEHCYNSMFSECTSLTTPPELPATTLADSCYYGMFEGCTSLQVSDIQTEQASYAWKIPTTGTFTNETTYNQEDMFYDCLGTRSSDEMSGAKGESHTYYTQNEPV